MIELRIALYLRVSTSKQAQHGYSLDAQKRECVETLKRFFPDNVG